MTLLMRRILDGESEMSEKLCIDCAFFVSPQGCHAPENALVSAVQRKVDRAVKLVTGKIPPLTYKEEYAILQRLPGWPAFNRCGSFGRWFKAASGV